MKTLTERLNFSQTDNDKSTNLQVNTTHSISYFDTLCMYCSDYDICLDNISDSDFHSAAIAIENHHKSAENNFYFWIDQE